VEDRYLVPAVMGVIWKVVALGMTGAPAVLEVEEAAG